MLNKKEIENIAYCYTVTSPSPLLGKLTDLETNTINYIIKAYMAKNVIFIRDNNGTIITPPVFTANDEIDIIHQLNSLVTDHKNKTYLGDLIRTQGLFVKWSDRDYILMSLLDKDMQIAYRKQLVVDIARVYSIPEAWYNFTDNQFEYYGTINYREGVEE